jgi:hypothetical protein
VVLPEGVRLRVTEVQPDADTVSVEMPEGVREDKREREALRLEDRVCVSEEVGHGEPLREGDTVSEALVEGVSELLSATVGLVVKQKVGEGVRLAVVQLEIEGVGDTEGKADREGDLETVAVEQNEAVVQADREGDWLTVELRELV